MIKRLEKIFVDYMGIENIEINRETNIKNDLGLNSFDLAQLVCNVEDEFDVEIPDSEMKNIKTVGDVVDYLEKASRLRES